MGKSVSNEVLGPMNKYFKIAVIFWGVLSLSAWAMDENEKEGDKFGNSLPQRYSETISLLDNSEIGRTVKVNRGLIKAAFVINGIVWVGIIALEAYSIYKISNASKRLHNDDNRIYSVALGLQSIAEQLCQTEQNLGGSVSDQQSNFNITLNWLYNVTRPLFIRYNESEPTCGYWKF